MKTRSQSRKETQTNSTKAMNIKQTKFKTKKVKKSQKQQKQKQESTFPELEQYKTKHAPDSRVHDNGITTLYVATRKIIRPVRTFNNRSEIFNYSLQQLRCDIHSSFYFYETIESVAILSSLSVSFQPYENGPIYAQPLNGGLLIELIGNGELFRKQFKIFDHWFKKQESNEFDFTTDESFVFHLHCETDLKIVDPSVDEEKTFISDYKRLLFDLLHAHSYNKSAIHQMFENEQHLLSNWNYDRYYFRQLPYLFDLFDSSFFHINNIIHTITDQELSINCLEDWYRFTSFLLSNKNEVLHIKLPYIKIQLNFQTSNRLLHKLKKLIILWNYRFYSFNKSHSFLIPHNLYQHWCYKRTDYSLLAFYTHYIICPESLDLSEALETWIDAECKKTFNNEKTTPQIKFLDYQIRFFTHLIQYYPGYFCQFNVKQVIVSNIQLLQMFIDQYVKHLENVKAIVNQIESQWNPHHINNSNQLTPYISHNIANIDQIYHRSVELQTQRSCHKVILEHLFLDKLNEISTLIHCMTTSVVYIVDKDSQTSIFEMENIWKTFIQHTWFSTNIIQTCLLIEPTVLLPYFELLQYIIELLPYDIRLFLSERRTTFVTLPVTTTNVLLQGFNYFRDTKTPMCLYDALKITKSFQNFNLDYMIEQPVCFPDCNTEFYFKMDRNLNAEPIEQWNLILKELKLINSHDLVFHCHFSYQNEEGIGFGVRNDVLLKIIDIMFSEDVGLFKSIDEVNGSKIFVLNNDFESEKYLTTEEYMLAGRLFALALLTVKGPIGVTFPRVILNYIQNHKNEDEDDDDDIDEILMLTDLDVCYTMSSLNNWELYIPPENYHPIENLKDIDIEKYQSLKHLLLNRSDDEQQYYELEPECPFTQESIKLIPQREDKKNFVSPSNIHMYIDGVTRNLFYGNMYYLNYFRLGYQSIERRFPYGPRFRYMIDLDIHNLMLGTSTIDVTWWRTHTTYICCEENTPIIQWFWNCITHKFTNEERMKLIEFVTTMKRVQSSYPFTFKIALTSNCSHKLPTASTCVSTLRLTDKYQTETQLYSDLQFIIQHEQMSQYFLE